MDLIFTRSLGLELHRKTSKSTKLLLSSASVKETSKNLSFLTFCQVGGHAAPCFSELLEEIIHILALFLLNYLPKCLVLLRTMKVFPDSHY